MYNSFLFKKNSQQSQREELIKKKTKKWNNAYKHKVQPALIEKYSRRINNFIVRLEEDKKDFYQYRQETETKARELLKEIYRKEKFIGDPTIKLRDISDWASMLSPTERIEKERNKRIFEHKFGDSDIAYRSIASQSAYSPADSAQFRTRDKKKQIHHHNMRFTSKYRSFSENRRERDQTPPKVSALVHQKTENSREPEVHRSISNNSFMDDEIRSQAFSLMSLADYAKAAKEDGESSTSNHKEPVPRYAKISNSNKVYFKQVVDLEQHSKDPTVKKSLHQILVRFGVSRIKDIKKQAMVQTDNLESDDF